MADRTVGLTTGNNVWENASVLMKAIDANLPVSWQDVVAYVPVGAGTVRLASGVPGTPTADGQGVTIAADKFRACGRLDFSTVWVKSAGGASSIEFSGVPA